MPELLLGLVGVPGVDHRDDDGEHPRRGGHEQSGHVAEAEGLGERGLVKGQQTTFRMENDWRFRTHEEGVEGQSNDVGGQGEHHKVDLVVLDGHLESIGSGLALAIVVGLSNILEKSQLRQLSLFIGESPSVSGKIWQDEHGQEGDTHGDGTLDPEEPSPGSVTERALHVAEDTGGDEGGESVGDEVTAEQDSVSEGQFPSGVPFRENEQGSGKEGSCKGLATNRSKNLYGETPDSPSTKPRKNRVKTIPT